MRARPPATHLRRGARVPILAADRTTFDESLGDNMKKIRWMVVVPLLTGALTFASTARADKPGKEIVVTPAADVKFMPIDPNDKEGKGPQISVLFGDMKKKGTPLGFLLKVPPGFKPGP